MTRLAELLHGGPVDDEEVRRVRDVLMYEEPGLRDRLTRFWVLLVLASAIATFGLVGDSVAAVIGAMIVAPLMLPIMGLAFCISIGDRRGIIGSLIVATSGIAIAIAVGYVLSLPFSPVLDIEGDTQIMARTAPRLVDLAAALATGLAGAFAIGRKDVSDTLPGVAIAISLVPPLANAGILFAHGRPELAQGSMLLFFTNYLAILLTGAFMFGIMGFPKATLAGRSRRARVTAAAIVTVLAVSIVAPLAATSYSVAVETAITSRTRDAVDGWLAGTTYRLAAIQVDEDRVLVVAAGTGRRPRAAELAAALGGRVYGRRLVVETLPQLRETYETD